MSAAPDSFDTSTNAFARIVYDDSLPLDEKKAVLTQALLFDITDPDKSKSHLEEFLGFREYLVSERERIIGEIAAVSVGDVLKSEKAKEEAPADAQTTGLGSVLKFFNTAVERGSEVLEKAGKAGKTLEGLVTAKGEIVAMYDLLEECSQAATEQNNEALKKLSAYVKTYNKSMSDAFYVEPGAVETMLDNGGRFLEQAGQAVTPANMANAAVNGVKKASAAAGKAVVKGSAKASAAAGKAVVMGSAKIVTNAAQKAAKNILK